MIGGTFSRLARSVGTAALALLVPWLAACGHDDPGSTPGAPELGVTREALCAGGCGPCEKCVGSTCTPSNSTNGDACADDGVACTTDVCASGVCTHPTTANGTACADDGNPCTTDKCNGTSTACQHAAGNAGTACTDDGNVCTTDLCNGASTTCQHAAGNAGTACTDDGNPCTTDLCNGASTTCQHAAGNAGTACTDDGNPCTTDLCNGTSTSCQHAAGNAGAACPDDGSLCTTDKCNGTSTTCQHAAANAGTVCRAAASVCDVAESCNGVSTTCPADGAAAAGITCRPAVDACDAVETCNGTSATCPADQLQPDGTACSDGTACTSGDACSAGRCVGTTVACTAQDACHLPGECAPATGTCSAGTAIATCNEADLDYVRVSVEYTTTSAVPVVTECNPYNNWSVTKGSPIYACQQTTLTPPHPFTVTRVFQATCPADQGPRWQFFNYSTSTPPNTRVEFRLRAYHGQNGTCPTLTAVTADPPAPIATASPTEDAQVCSLSGVSVPCVKNLFSYLGSTNATDECVQMDAYGVPSSTDTPLLYDWAVSYTCVANQ